jgi:hypothetical protein
MSASVASKNVLMLVENEKHNMGKKAIDYNKPLFVK